MRLHATLPVLGAIFFALGCSGRPSSGSAPTATHFTDEKGIDYIHNGDPVVIQREKEALTKTEPAVSVPLPSPTPVPTPEQKEAVPTSPEAPIPTAPSPEPAKTTKTKEIKPLRARVREFEISRFAQGSQNPSRFGDSTFELKIFFRDRGPAVFKGKLIAKLGKQFSFQAEDDVYQIRAELTDNKEKSVAQIKLLDTHSKEEIEISYRAYRAKLNLRPDRDKGVAQGSVYDRQLKSLGFDANAKDPKVSAFGWVNNWNVVNGPSFYLVDIVRLVSADEKATEENQTFALSFRGESKRTSGESETYEHPAESLTPETASSVLLIGNPEEGNRRLFQVTLEDKDSKEKNDILIDLEMMDPEEEEVISEDEPIEYGGKDLQELAYLTSDLSLPRSRRMIEDLNRNEYVPGVRKEIAIYQRKNRASLENFFYYAHPFRPILETIGRGFDISPAFAYVTVIESPYFTGGKYRIARPPIINKKTKKRLSSALGPFQLLVGTGERLGLTVVRKKDSPRDERNYFVPSACAAARYFIELADQFWHGDTTFAILGYYQGQMGAEAAIGCGVGHPDTESQQKCAERVNPHNSRHLKEKELRRYKEISRRFNTTYAEIERLGYMPKNFRNYVNRKLAAYFIATQRARYGFSSDTKGAKHFPKNGTVMPPFPIHDKFCRETVGELNLD